MSMKGFPTLGRYMRINLLGLTVMILALVAVLIGTAPVAIAATITVNSIQASEIVAIVESTREDIVLRAS